MKYLLLILSALSLISCEKYLEFEGDEAPNRLAVNGFFTDDEAMTVHVSRTQSLLDEASIKSIENALVELYDKNGALIETLPHDEDGYYKATEITGNLNENYSVKVQANGFDQVEAESSIPNNSMTITSAEARLTDSGSNFDGSGILLEVDYTESSVSDQYYGLVFESGYFDEATGEIDYFEIYPDELGGISNVSAYLQNEVLFNDAIINGRSGSMEVEVNSYYVDSYSDTPILPNRLRVTVKSYSYDSFQHQRTYAIYLESEFAFLATPVQVYTNVENGLGVFGGYNEEVFEIELN